MYDGLYSTIITYFLHLTGILLLGISLALGTKVPGRYLDTKLIAFADGSWELGGHGMIYSRGNEEAEVTMRIEKGENMEC
jgi:hypothetical protein